MKTAKEMLAIAQAVQKERDASLWGEHEVMELIATEAAKGETSVYTSMVLMKGLIPKLEQHGYSVSDFIYENRDEGMFESCISWGNEE